MDGILVYRRVIPSSFPPVPTSSTVLTTNRNNCIDSSVPSKTASKLKHFQNAPFPLHLKRIKSVRSTRARSNFPFCPHQITRLPRHKKTLQQRSVHATNRRAWYHVCRFSCANLFYKPPFFAVHTKTIKPPLHVETFS